MLAPEFLAELPVDDSGLREWNLWKNSTMTACQNAFVDRHPWFKFRKFDLFDNLAGQVKIPKIYNRSLLTDEKKSSFFDAMSLYGVSGNVVVKEVYGHSCKEVKIFDLASVVDGTIYEHLTKSRVRVGEVERWWLESQCVVEEYLGGCDELIPLDFKVYCVDGRARYIAIVDRNFEKPIFTFVRCSDLRAIPWDEIYPDKPRHMWSESVDMSPSLLKRVVRAMDEAERICRDVLSVHGILVGIDTYSLPEGAVYLGEITPRMGAMHGLWLKKKFIRQLFLNEKY